MAAASTDIRVPSECREMIRAGALLAINTSGGKDRAVVRRTILTPQYQATSMAYRADRRTTHAPNNTAFLRRDPPVG